MRGSILMSHFLMTKIATARAKQEQRNQDLARSPLRAVEELISIHVFSPLLFCWVVVCVKNWNVSSAHSFFVRSLFLSLTPHFGSGQSRGSIWSGADITTQRGGCLSLYQPQSINHGPSVPCIRPQLFPAAHNALVTCHLWVVSTSQSELSMGPTDQSEASVESVPMAQAQHSLLPGHMGPDVQVPTLRGEDTACT